MIIPQLRIRRMRHDFDKMLTKNCSSSIINAAGLREGKIEGMKTGLALRRVSGAKLLSVCFLTAFLVITLMSRCSFLYPMNTWCDANCFYTVGRAIANGRVLYRDIYEQKGPLLYFLHACVEWIPGQSVNPFLEIYILEVLAATATLYFLARTLLLYRPCRGWRLAAWVALLGVLVYANRSFSHGDSAEEFVLVMAAYVLYATLRMLKSEPHDISRGSLYAIGVLAGFVFWCKYICLSYALGAMVVPLAVALRERNYRLIGRALAFVLLGALTASVPVICYFAYHRAFDALWEAYFYNNIFLYGNAGSLLWKIRFIGGKVISYLWGNLRYVLFALLGWIYALCSGRRREAWHVFSIVAAVMLVILLSARLFVYGLLPLATLSVTGVIALDELLGRVKAPRARVAAQCALLAACCVVLLRTPVRSALREARLEREDVLPYRIASVMEQTPEATLLDLYLMDSGIYTAADILPPDSTRYFCYLNLQMPQMHADWQRIIREAEVDYIYTGWRRLEELYSQIPDPPYVLVYGQDADERLYMRRDLSAQTSEA